MIRSTANSISQGATLLFLLFSFLPTSSASDETEIEKIVVTSSKLNRSAFNEHGSLVVVTEQELAVTPDRDLADVFVRQANLSIGSINQQPRIRGLTRGGFAGNFSTVFFMIDGGLYSAFPERTTVPLWDLSQVEVLRGAQSIAPLSTVGGVVSLTSQLPIFNSFDGHLAANYIAEGDQRDLGFAQNIGILEDELAVRVATYLTKEDGFLTNTFNGDDEISSEDRKMYRLSARYHPNSLPNTQVNFTYQKIDESLGARALTNQIAPQLGFDPYSRNIDLRIPEFADNDIDFAVLKVSHQLSDQWDLDALLTYQDVDIDALYAGNRNPLNTGFSLTQLSTDLTTLEFRANRKGEFWDIKILSYFRRVSSKRHSQVSLSFDLDGPGPVPTTTLLRSSNDSSTNNQYSLMLFGSRSIGDRWSVDLGLRIHANDDPAHFQSSSRNVSPPSAFTPLFDAIAAGAAAFDFKQRAGETDWLPMIDIGYAISEKTTFGFKADRAARSGGLSVNRATGDLREYGSEIAENFELYARSHQGNFYLAANLFQTNFKEMQVVAFLSTRPFDQQTYNAEKAELRGLEISAAYQPTPTLQLTMGLGFLDTEFSDYDVPSRLDFTGNELPGAPEVSATVGVRYGRDSGFYANADLIYQKEAFSLAGNEPGNESDARTLANARVGWRGKHWQISLFGNNLFDEEYLEGVFFVTGVVGKPREFGLSIATRW